MVVRGKRGGRFKVEVGLRLGPGGCNRLLKENDYSSRHRPAYDVKGAQTGGQEGCIWEGVCEPGTNRTSVQLFFSKRLLALKGVGKPAVDCVCEKSRRPSVHRYLSAEGWIWGVPIEGD